MKVILLNNIKGVGRIGDIKEVSDGYARNLLIPRKMAKMATDSSLKEAEALRSKALNQNRLQSEQAVKALDQIKDVTIEFTKKMSEAGTLFAAITPKDIAKALTDKTGVRIDEDMVSLDEFEGHIKHGGNHIIPIALSDEVKTQINVVVKAEE